MKNVTYSLDEETIETVDRLSVAWATSKTAVVRTAVASLSDVAAADAGAVLVTLRERHGPEQLAIWVTEGADGEPDAHVRIGGTEPADVGARAVLSPDGRSVFVFLDLVTDDHADVLVPLGGDDALLVRARFSVERLPWPPGQRAILLDLGAVQV